MSITLADIAQPLGQAILAALKPESARLKALALAEGEALAAALVRIAGLTASGVISTDEAAVLLRIQRDASEAVLASLAESSRLAAHKAIGAGLHRLLESALGQPGISGLIRAALA